MAAPRKSQKAETDEAPQEPTVEDPQVIEDLNVVEDDPTPEAPRAAAAPRSAHEDGDSGPDQPRPWRVETFSDGDLHGWRLAAANGVVIRESGLDYSDAQAASNAARDEDFADHATFQNDEVQPTLPRGW